MTVFSRAVVPDWLHQPVIRIEKLPASTYRVSKTVSENKLVREEALEVRSFHIAPALAGERFDTSESPCE